MIGLSQRVLVALAWAACALGVRGQETLEVKGPEPALVALGDEAVVELVIENGTSRPGTLNPPQVPGLSVRVEGPRENSWVRIVNGRRASGRTSSYTLRLKPRRTGRFEIPPFRFDTGTREQVVPKIVLDCEKSVANANRGFLELTAIPARAYVGEPVQFVFDVGVDTRTTPNQDANKLVHVFVEQPWLESPDGMVTVEGADEVAGGSRVTLGFNGVRTEAAYTPDHERDGRTFHRFTFTRTLMPGRSGRFEIGDSTMMFEFGGPQSPFDSRRPNRVFVYGEPLSVEVVPLPTEGRPSDFGNAVGRFELEATVDRRRVRVGDSVKLVVTIRGRGNNEFLEVPELGELDGLHPLGTNENRSRDRIVVEYDLTPLREDVTRLPGVTWSYFDTTPGVERYVTITTDPIPIAVDPPAEGEGLAALPGEEAAAVVVGVDDIHDMKPAAGSDPVPLEPTPGPARSAAWVLAPWLLCLTLAAFVRTRRRRRADVRGRRAANARKHYRALRDEDPTAALVAYVADRLDWPDAAVIGPDLAERLQAAGVESELARDLQVAIDSGTAARYGGGRGPDAAAADALVDRLAPIAVKPGSVAVALAVALSLAGPSPAQADVHAGERYYRAGDYAAAAREFAAAVERPDADRRMLYNLGNSLYRDGRLAEALVAYERARLAMPRDPELLANIAVVERKLELARGEGEPFFEAVASVRDRFTSVERLWGAVVSNLLAAVALVFGSRVVRWIGAVILVPALLLALEVVWLGPSRPQCAIVLPAQVNVVAEPRAGLEPVLKLRSGVRVEVLGHSEAWASVRANGRQGYVPAHAIGLVH